MGRKGPWFLMSLSLKCCTLEEGVGWSIARIGGSPRPLAGAQDEGKGEGNL